MATYKNPNQKALDEATNKVLNFESSYDVNTDPAYMSLKTTAQREGQRAMRDTMAEASALTGGMPNSWAVSAGQQANDYYNEKVNDAIPGLMEAARNAAMSKLGVLQQQDESLYNRYNNDRQYDYQVSRDKVLDGQWLQQFNHTVQQDLISNAIAKRQITVQEGQLALSQAQNKRESESWGIDKQLKEIQLNEAKNPKVALDYTKDKTFIDTKTAIANGTRKYEDVVNGEQAIKQQYINMGYSPQQASQIYYELLLESQKHKPKDEEQPETAKNGKKPSLPSYLPN